MFGLPVYYAINPDFWCDSPDQNGVEGAFPFSLFIVAQGIHSGYTCFNPRYAFVPSLCIP